MTRWSIRKLLFYSHDRRRRDIDFDLSAVNIITGNSNTGKSAIAEVIDFVMGSKECHIPERIRNACSWVGILWEKENNKYLVCRKTPEAHANISNDFFFLSGENIHVPEDDNGLHSIANRDGGLKQFEKVLGIGEVKSEVFDSETKTPVRVSARNLMPYLLLDDDVIISKTTLFRGANDQRRQGIIDTLPYFLGIVDERTLAKKAELARLKKKLAVMERHLSTLRKIKGEETGIPLSLLSEANQVGLFKGIIPQLEEISVAELAKTLEGIANWTSGQALYEGEDKLPELNKAENELLSEIRILNSKIDTSKSFLSLSSEFSETTNIQRKRLQSIELIPREQNNTCPLCCQHIDEKNENIANILGSYDKIESELGRVERDRPKLDGLIQELMDQKEKMQERLASIRAQKAALIRESEAVQVKLDLDQRRQRVVGRISLYLEAERPEEISMDLSEYEQVKSTVEQLESELSEVSKLDALQDIAIILSQKATHIISSLPFDKNYRERPVSFNARDLTVGVITVNRRINMRDIGSDENYLSFHIAILLALHRYFAEAKQPVPGVLLLDQLSRPYYPADPHKPQKELIVSKSEEVENLKQYFDFLFKEVESQPSLQIIVLEHAYFTDDERFVKATKERWVEGRALIPEDWPVVN